MEVFTKKILLIIVVISIFNSLTHAQNLNSSIVSDEVIFEEQNGLLVVEAEHFYRQSLNQIRQWYKTSKNELANVGNDPDPPHYEGASNDTYLEILPDTRVTHADKLIKGENFSNEPGKMGVLHYKVNINTVGRYYVWVRAFSTGSEDNGIHVGIDGDWPESGQRMQWCKDKNSWKWESKQRTEAIHCGEPYLIYLDIEKVGIHDIQFSMREDGFEFDSFLLTNNKEFIPEGIVTASKQFNSVKNSEVLGTLVTGELKKWHKVTLTFDGPETSETEIYNPFLNYRLDVVFSHAKSGKKYKIPGYFAADGNAGETSANSGNKWKVHFAPDEIGLWTYSVSFRKGDFAALTYMDTSSDSAGFMDGMSGNILIANSDKSGIDLRSKGRLQYIGERYLKFAENGEYFLKVGPDAPENFLSYVDFDGTFHNDGHNDDLVKTWEAHLKHWKTGDPEWKDGKGKAMVGAINYLASKGMNVFSFLTFNIGGDDKNVFPFIDYDTWNRYDCSKLDQWEVVFEHADKMGMFLHFKLSEYENQGLLDNGGIGANTMLYYREIIARFGHHLALNWNIGEENGEWIKKNQTLPMNTEKRLAAAAYLDKVDAYNHHIVIHNGASFKDLLGPNSKITGPSIQTNKPDFHRVHGEALKWINESKKAGKQWAVAVDEPGDAMHSLLPDSEDPLHNDARKNGLWGAFMAGAWGTEWYFGYKHAHSDLTCQDYASRDLFWNQCSYLVEFFKKNNIPFWETENHDELVAKGDYCLGKLDDFYIVYLKNGQGFINLEKISGEFSVEWYNPRKGGDLQKGKVNKISGGAIVTLTKAPSDANLDWVVLLKK